MTNRAATACIGMNRHLHERVASSAQTDGVLPLEGVGRPEETSEIAEPSWHSRAIFEAHFRLVWIALSRLGVHEPDLVELTQEVFLEAYRRPSELRNRAGLSVWICGICRAVANQYVPTEAAAIRLGVESLSLPEASEEASGYTVDHSPDREHMARILDKLTRRQRLVFVLFELDALSGVEIGALLGIGLHRVHRLLYAARATFLQEAARSHLPYSAARLTRLVATRREREPTN